MSLSAGSESGIALSLFQREKLVSPGLLPCTTLFDSIHRPWAQLEGQAVLEGAKQGCVLGFYHLPLGLVNIPTLPS